MSKKIVVQAYNSDTGVIGPVESENSVVEVFAKASGTSLIVGDFVYLNTSRELAKAVATYSLGVGGKKMATAAIGIVKKVLSATSCEVTLSGVTTIVAAVATATGDVLYLSSSSPGTTTPVAPTAETSFCQPVAKIIAKTGSTLIIRLLTNSLDELLLDNISRISTLVTFSNLSTDPALVVGSGESPANKESLFVNGDLAATGNIDADSITVDTSVTANSAAIGGAITANSAAITGQVAAASALFSGSISATNATIGNSIGVGSVYALTKIDIGGTLLAPNASIDGASGTVSAVDVEASGILTGAGLSVTGTESDAIFTNGGVKANGKLFGGSAEIINSSGYGSLTISRLKGSPQADDTLAEIHLADVTVAGGSPVGGASILCAANENWVAGSRGSKLYFCTTQNGTINRPPQLTLTGSVADFDVPITAPNVSPFTGCHYYPCDTEILVGSCVVLNDGKAEISNSAMAKNCVGIALSCEVSDIDSLSGTSEGLKVVVAAVGDNRSGPLTGFLVCDEGGPVYAGDLLCTSSTPGYLMKQSDDIVRSYTVGKALQNVTFDSDGKASGVYGTICCG